MTYLLYLLIFFPWVMRYLENGTISKNPVHLVSETTLSILIGLGVYAYIRQRERLDRQRMEMERMASIDPLTGLGNSRFLKEVLVKEVARARRTDRPLSCILLDLDDFRLMNDRFGHEKGDQVLKVVAQKIGEVIRQAVDRAFRYGGDEFIILLPETKDDQVLAVAQRLREAFIALRPPTIPKKSLSASFGIAELRDGQNAEDLLRSVDRAINQAKTKGKNIIYDAALLDS
jgi:diguanylate cyclase (GGDEF)-like protein